MLKTFLAVVLNELKQIFRIKEVTSVLIIGLVTYFFFYPIPYNNEEVRDVPIAVMDQNQTTMSRELLRNLDATDSLKIVDEVENIGEAKELLKQRKIYGIIVIPFDFEQNILKGHRDAVVFYGDASYVMIYNSAATAVSSVVMAMNRDILVDKQIAMGVDPAIAMGNSAPFNPVNVQLFNPQAGYATYIIPPAYVLILHQSIWLGIMLACVLSRRSQFDLDLVKNSTLSIGQLGFATLFGKYIAYLFYASFAYWIFMLFAPYWYQLPRLSSIMDLAVFGFFFLSAVIMLALSASVLFKKMDNLFLLVLPFSMIFFFFSGMSWPQYLMPDLFLVLARILPSTSSIEGLVHLNQMGATLEHVKSQLMNLIALIAVYGAIAYFVIVRYLTKLKQGQ
ncbi:ABC transporter permease [Wohlfahrtiimonas populi]|uniref:ABC transporter permease n=1 Tax=Wohlfahrtiimonas populi TaxID=1940240 RepID=UPI00098D40FA|nr:ABC transporter permease [Wohlfahrtiimonas populi]